MTSSLLLYQNIVVSRDGRIKSQRCKGPNVFARDMNWHFFIQHRYLNMKNAMMPDSLLRISNLVPLVASGL